MCKRRMATSVRRGEEKPFGNGSFFFHNIFYRKPIMNPRAPRDLSFELCGCKILLQVYPACTEQHEPVRISYSSAELPNDT